MKILVITDLFPTDNNKNHGIFIFHWVNYLAKKFDVTVFQVVWKKRINSSILDPAKLFSTISDKSYRFKWHQEFCNYFPVDRLWIRNFQFYRNVIKSKKIKVKNFDIIIGQMGNPGGFVATKLGKKYKIRSIVGVRGSDVNRYLDIPILKYFAIWTYKNCNHIIAVSESLKKELILKGIPPNKITTIYNGINQIFKPIEQTIAREKLGLCNNKKIVIYVGHLTYLKGIHYLLKAISKVKTKNISLYIIGEGEYHNNLQSLVKQLGLNNITFVGEKRQSELLYWYNAADILCLPSLSEGMPNVVLESLACGTPVIATDISDISDIINKDNGVLINPEKIYTLNKAIDKVLSKKWKFIDISKSIKGYNWDSNLNQYSKIIYENTK